MDKYQSKWVKVIKTCETDEEIAGCVNKIYEDGFEDGHNESK